MKYTRETFYDILKVKEDASYDEIRRSYRSALLQSHPDKLHNSFNMANRGSDDVEDRFREVQKAWETLSDSKSRTLYDNELQSLRSDVLVADDIALEDMMVEDTGDALEFFHQCRCGEFFLISGSELEEMGYELCKDEDEIYVRIPEAFPGSVILPCGSCSLRIRLFINTK